MWGREESDARKKEKEREMTVIFNDLGIDHSTMMSDPKSFAENVYAAANILKTTLKGDNSVEHYIKNLPKIEYDGKDWNGLLNAVWNVAYDAPIQHIQEMAKAVRNLANSIEYIATAKAQEELATKISTVDKFTAHKQYMSLRDKFNQWVKTMRVFGLISEDIVELPPMPGNYGTPVGLIHYIFRFEGDDEFYRNHYAVCRKLGVDEMNLMDTVDFVEKNPQYNCTVTRLTN